MKQVFLDTDVVMDFLTKREPFVIESMKLIEYSHRNELELSISSLSLSNIHYLIARLENKPRAREKVKAILPLVQVLSVNRSTIETAAFSDFKDFEDAIQNYCAQENNLHTLITRNVKDYQHSDLSILTPREFIIQFEKGL